MAIIIKKKQIASIIREIYIANNEHELERALTYPSFLGDSSQGNSRPHPSTLPSSSGWRRTGAGSGRRRSGRR